MLWAIRAVTLPRHNSIADSTVRPLAGLVSGSLHETYHSLSHLQRSALGLCPRGRVPVVDFYDATTGRRWRWDARHRTMPSRELLELWGPQQAQPMEERPAEPTAAAEADHVSTAAAGSPGAPTLVARVDRRAQVLALLLRHRGDWLTPSEVAAELGCSRGAARACLRRAARAGVVRHNGERGRASRYTGR